MTSRVSLVEQKKLQWAKEREEMARLSGHLESRKAYQHSAIRANVRLSREVMNDASRSKPLRAVGIYGSTSSLQSLADQNSVRTTTSLRTIDFSTGSLINLHESTDFSQMRPRSPSLPPIYTRENQQSSRHIHQENTRDLGVEGLRYSNKNRSQKQDYRQTGKSNVENPYEEREGETSGYASDSIEPPAPSGGLVKRKIIDGEMSERTWQNPYCETPESSLPESGRHQSLSKLGELNRQRWGGIWGGEDHDRKTDPPAPSWLERSLSRLDHPSQILVINHDSASSPDSSTNGSTGSDSKTYIRGQNIPVDAQVLQEREVRRQQARELQKAIKQQLEEKDRLRKVEREQRLREEREEEERIKREREIEQERYEEEQRRIGERERAKLKKEEAMREVLESAEKRAREMKKQRRHRDDDERESSSLRKNSESNCWRSPKIRDGTPEISDLTGMVDDGPKNKQEIIVENSKVAEKMEERPIGPEKSGLTLPIGKEVAILLSGRLDDTDLLNRANLQLVNLVVTSPRNNESASTSSLNESLSALVKTFANPIIFRKSPRSGTIISPRISENRVLTPSKYRHTFSNSGRDFGTQTDGENELQDSSKDLKEDLPKDVEKSTSTGLVEDSGIKSLSRSKSQPRTSLESRPRWNANRPGTRYRTQSEKDPHYQRRMRLRSRRRLESSDERSRSPSPERRKSPSILNKPKSRNLFNRRKVKMDSYDADLSMDSLHSVVPLRIDEHGRVNLLPGDILKKRNKISTGDEDTRKVENDEKFDLWCSQEILSQLASLRNGLLSKQREWDSQRCLLSPSGDYY